jgi:hypothetical protein
MHFRTEKKNKSGGDRRPKQAKAMEDAGVQEGNKNWGSRRDELLALRKAKKKEVEDDAAVLFPNVYIQPPM